MSSPATTEPSRPVPAAIVAPLAVFAIALVTRLFGLHHTPYVDELNHVMAAHSLLAHGTLELTPGGEPYARARLFTYLTAALFRVFGESLAVARIPAVIAGAALVAVLFVWVRSVAGRAAAWIAAVLFCFQPQSIYLSQLARFYTIQTLCFFGGAILIYRAVTDRSLTVARELQLFSYVDQWAAANRHNTRYYHDIFLDQYGTIWTLFPLLAILAIYRNGR